jgi:DNA polymerase-1
MRDIIEWRENNKMLTSFYGPMLERTEDTPDNPVVYTKINPYKVTTRRIASSDPNLTAIPTRNEIGVQVRDGFEADSPDRDPEDPDTFVFGSWDLSQVEMRYMAHLSGDVLMKKFFNEKNPLTGKDFDIHAETAARIFGIKIEDVKEMEHRYPSKRAGFGIITNIAGAGLYDQLRMFGCPGWSVDKCDDLIKEWLNVYKGVKQFLIDTKRDVRNTGFVQDEWGMPRYLPGVWSEDKRVVGESERAASSHRIQGGAQGMLQSAIVWLKPYIRAMVEAGEDIRWVLQIHDEIILRFRRGMWETIDPLVVEGLTQHSLKLSVPIKAKGNYARTWGKLK